MKMVHFFTVTTLLCTSTSCPKDFVMKNTPTVPQSPLIQPSTLSNRLFLFTKFTAGKKGRQFGTKIENTKGKNYSS
jgi:hypothetical protein